MKKKAVKLVISKETLRLLGDRQLSQPAGGIAVAESEDRRCEPSIVSCLGDVC